MRLFPVLLLLVAAACAEREKMGSDAQSRQPYAADDDRSGLVQAAAEAAVASAASVADTPTVVFVGTSLTAGYGLAPERAYPAVVGRLAAAENLPIRVVNAGLSGETSAGALRRVDWVLRSPAHVVVVETGANDGLRALDVDATRDNVAVLIRRIRSVQPGARLFLVQMEAPPNFGPDYTTLFREMYPAIARETGATLIPFLLEGVAAVPEMNQADGIHPNVAGAERVAQTVWAALRPAVGALQAQR
jgi:acyl-CoA thioesterase-1